MVGKNRRHATSKEMRAFGTLLRVHRPPNAIRHDLSPGDNYWDSILKHCRLYFPNLDIQDSRTLIAAAEQARRENPAVASHACRDRPVTAEHRRAFLKLQFHRGLSNQEIAMKAGKELNIVSNIGTCRAISEGMFILIINAAFGIDSLEALLREAESLPCPTQKEFMTKFKGLRLRPDEGRKKLLEEGMSDPGPGAPGR